MIKLTKKDGFGPMFKLYGADKDKPLSRHEYFDGQLIKINEN